MEAKLEHIMDSVPEMFVEDGPPRQFRRGQLQLPEQHHRARGPQRSKVVMITDPNLVMRARRHDPVPPEQEQPEMSEEEEIRILAEQKAAQVAKMAEIAAKHAAQQHVQVPSPQQPLAISPPFSVHPSMQSLMTAMTIILVLAALNWGVFMSMGGRRDAVWFMTATASSKTRRTVELLVYGFVTSVAVSYLILLALASRGEFDERVQRRVVAPSPR